MNSDPLSKQLSSDNLPSHVAIIMDGNGRWAQKRLLNRLKGHEQGSETVRTIVRTSRKIGISALTLYAFSTENWQRPKTEVSALMHLLKRFLKTEKEELLQNNIRLNMIGQLHRLPEDVARALQETMQATAQNEGMVLTLALSYGSRTEIVDMVQKIVHDVQTNKIDPQHIDERLVSDYLYTKDLPDPDLLIRTSGEMRISNFLLWQIAYAEIHVTKTLWPEFSESEYLDIIRDYQSRDRRFGKINTN